MRKGQEAAIAKAHESCKVLKARLMIRWMVVFVALALVGCAGRSRGPVAQAPPAPPEPSPREVASATASPSVLVTQANRGALAYEARCSGCHGPDLAGGWGPPLAGDLFYQGWKGRTASALFTYTQRNMPQGLEGGLSEQEYVDIVTHMLKGHGVEAVDGARELTAEDLRRIVIE